METKFSEPSLIPDESDHEYDKEVVIEEPTQEPGKSSEDTSNILKTSYISAGRGYLNKR